jgi:hypothetical protein
VLTIEKGISPMQDNSSNTRQLLAGSLPVQELEEGFNDWIRQLRTILEIQEDPLRIPYERQRTAERRDQLGNADPPIGWRQRRSGNERIA